MQLARQTKNFTYEPKEYIENSKRYSIITIKKTEEPQDKTNKKSNIVIDNTIKNNEIAKDLIDKVKNAKLGIKLEYELINSINKQLKEDNANNKVICNSLIWGVEDSIANNEIVDF